MHRYWEDSIVDFATDYKEDSLELVCAPSRDILQRSGCSGYENITFESSGAGSGLLCEEPDDDIWQECYGREWIVKF